MALPPTTPQGLIRDSESINEWANSENLTLQNRAGEEILTLKGVIQSAVDDAVGVAAAQDAISAKNTAQEAAAQAQISAEAAASAGSIYETSSAGQSDAELSDGDYFWVVSSGNFEILELWQKGASSPTDTGKKLNRGLESVRLVNIGPNQNFANDDNLFTTQSVIDNVANNIATFTTTGNYGSLRQLITPNPGHKYYVAMKVLSGDSESFFDAYQIVSSTGTQLAVKNHTGSGEFEFLDSIFETNFTESVQLRFVERRSGNTASVKQFVLLDLTSIFGAGNEPTISEIRAILSQTTQEQMFFTNNDAERYVSITTNDARNKPYYVHIEGDSLTVIQKYTKALDIKFVWKRLYPNFVFNLFQIYFINNTSPTVSNNYSGGNLLNEFQTDTLGPYRVKALTNIDGDDLDNNNFTGGSHGYNNDYVVDPTNTPTARLDKLAFYVNQQEVSFFSGYVDTVEARWTNFVQANNTKKADGSGREVLREDYHLQFLNGKAHVNNFIEFLEPVQVNAYYGLQASDLGLYRGAVYYHSAQNKKLNAPLVNSNSGDRNCDKITLSRQANYFDLALDTSTGLGKQQPLATVAHNAFYTTSPKVYFWLIEEAQYDANDVVTYAGSYRYYNDSTNL